MSALLIENKRGCGRACANRCHSKQGVRAAVVFISVANWPFPGINGHTGYFCQTCRREIEDNWTAALTGNFKDGKPVNVCSCGCGTEIPKGRTWTVGHQMRNKGFEMAA